MWVPLTRVGMERRLEQRRWLWLFREGEAPVYQLP